ncbi:ribosomal L7Ae/L30e/S12e/Gadd45 family protein [Virgibacillus alimentarius]|uniref:Large subunit ribosomal protein L7A n=1 Tax=Virgibacillus alimentarius TaxID=698769 RepID=A0ABS4S974_9BACI|nr:MULTISPECIES: ribosomal L7Ae/L30e/S12e/Gadd45 family protein [Virgibacillus]MBP2258044.1 large subunit ribosomal protein L7A [Virgibacillus alimentarius]HLR65888.1 ribosomal L7Ae/L30e/S12e/Gadd45 family protein [Virgibacillus sp.]
MSYEKVSQVQSYMVIGTKQTLKAMKKGGISKVFIADDADQQLTQRVVHLAKELNIPCERVDSMKKLGTACGVDVATSTAGVKQH